MRISVYGAGYVGAVTSACLARSGHSVMIVDVDVSKIEKLSRGHSPIVEKGLDSLLASAVHEGRLLPTTDAQGAFLNTEMSLICVGTPSSKNGHIDYSYLKDISRQLGAFLKEKQEYHIIVIRSTILPNSTRDILIPILEKASGKVAGQDFGVGYNPEFLREGTAVQDYFDPTQIIAGSLNPQDAVTIMSIYDNIEASKYVVSLNVAEAIKYVSNIWRASKISFANEMGNILQSFGLNSHEVMDIFVQDTKINMSKYFLKPGFAFGGSCLPKDVRAMRAYAKDTGIDTSMLDAVLQTNKNQVARAARLIKDSGAKNILLLGLAFKPDTDDLRESAYVDLARQILDEDINVKIIDPSLLGQAHDCRSLKQREYGDLMGLLIDLKDVNLSDQDLVVLGHDIPEFITLLRHNTDIPVLALSKPSDNTISNVKGLCY